MLPCIVVSSDKNRAMCGGSESGLRRIQIGCKFGLAAGKRFDWHCSSRFAQAARLYEPDYGADREDDCGHRGKFGEDSSAATFRAPASENTPIRAKLLNSA